MRYDKRGSALRLKLAVIQFLIKAVCLQKLLMSAAFNDIALIHDKYKVGVTNGGQSVRYDKRGSALGELIHRLLNECLGACINRACRLIKDYHRCVFDHGPCDGKQLPLTGGQAAAVTEHGIVALGQGHNEMIHAHRLTGRADLIIGDIFLAVDNVFTVCTLKQPCILQNHSEQRVNIAALHFGYRHSVDAYLTAPQFVETHKKIYHRGLAGTGVAYNRDFLSGHYTCREIVNNSLILVITEADMVKVHLSGDLFGISGAIAVIGKLLFLEEAENSLACRTGGHELAGCLRYLRKRTCKQAHIGNEGHNRAEGDVTAHCQRRADNADGNIAEIADKTHKRHHKSAEELGFPCAFVQIVVYALKLRLCLTGCAVDANYVMSRVHLLNMTVHVAEVLLLPAEIFF